jgi:hypothetical protein
VDLRIQIGDLLLREGDGIGAGDKAARRRLLAVSSEALGVGRQNVRGS